MKSYLAIIERDAATGLYVGHVPGFHGAHTQGASLDEVNANLREELNSCARTGNRCSIQRS